MLYLLLKSKRAKDSFDSQSILLKNIKNAISSQTKTFNGFSEQVWIQVHCRVLDGIFLSGH